jgi:hypothetical protein
MPTRGVSKGHQDRSDRRTGKDGDDSFMNSLDFALLKQVAGEESRDEQHDQDK